MFVRSGGTWTQQQQIVAPDGQALEDNFGVSVSLSGDTLLVGNSLDDDLGPDTGAAYVYVRTGTTWALEQKLTPSFANPYDHFGVTASLSGDTAIIGAANHNTTGAAYVFVRNGTTWSEQQKLTPPGTISAVLFGYSVSVAGDTALVGAPNFNGDEIASGKAYAFVRLAGAWSLQQALTAPTEGAYAAFGSSLTLAGDRALVGAPSFTTSNGSGDVYSFERDGSTWFMKAHLSSVDLGLGDQFGRSIALSGDTVVVGARYDDDLATDAGAAYVFYLDGSQDVTGKLTAWDPASSDFFGASVSASADTVIAGAPGDDDEWEDEGSAYVFVRSGGTWTDHQKLTGSNTSLNHRFGGAVSLAGDTAVVAAETDGNLGNLGSAYVFERTGGQWAEQAQLTSSDGPWSGDWFGRSVSISGDTVFVGAPQNDGVGAAYVYERSGGLWSETQKVTALAPMANWFGYSLSVSGERAIVGAPNPSGIGSVYLFERIAGIWVEQQQLTGFDTVADDWFGARVFLSGDTAIVGAFNDDDAGQRSGSAYIFAYDGTTWVQQQKLTASDAAAGDRFGSSVSISGTRAIVGAVEDDDAGDGSGSAYIFERDGGLWVEKAKVFAPDGSPNGRFGDSVAMFADMAVVGASWGSHNGWARPGAAYVFGVAGAGDACTQDTGCASGFCVDGACCDAACGGDDAADCQACTSVSTGQPDGTCAPIVAGTECRAAAGACDLAEVCDGSGVTCPADGVALAGVTCREATGTCDVEEQCDGASVDCPADGAAPDGSACEDGDSCTAADTCTAGVCEPGQDTCGTGGSAGGMPSPPVEEEGGGCTVSGEPGRERFPLEGRLAFALGLASWLCRIRRRRVR